MLCCILWVKSVEICGCFVVFWESQNQTFVLVICVCADSFKIYGELGLERLRRTVDLCKASRVMTSL